MPPRSLQLPITPPPKRRAVAVNAASASTSKEPLKQESLNPRLLKHSPASHEIRLKLVKLAYAEIKRLNEALKRDGKHDRLVLSDQAIITRILNDEESTAVGKPAVYTNIMKNYVMKYKRLQLADWIRDRQKEMPESKKRQHDVMQGDALLVETGLTPAQEVGLLQRLLTPIDGLANHGYVASPPTDAAIAAARDGLAAAKGWEQCDRCSQRFQVFAGRRPEDGALTSGGACNFHWGKAYFPEKTAGSAGGKQPKRFLCCGEQMGDSAGCFTHPNHVFKVGSASRLAAVLAFAATPENPAAPPDRAVCFDCEMGYTVHGMELIRLTATSWPDGAEILDVLVRPLGEILDLNSRFSGVWPDDLARAALWCPGDPLVPPTTDADSSCSHGSEEGQVAKKRLQVVSSPAVARTLLFSLIAPSTPLLGHGLENDLNAVRVVHPTLIDTVLVFPHKAGLPFRLGLKGLMSTHLHRRIQVQHGPKMLGHDSAEDARAAGELVRFRLAREWADMKRAGWTVVDGALVAPPGGDDDDDDDDDDDAAGPANDSDGGGRLTEDFIEAAAE